MAYEPQTGRGPHWLRDFFPGYFALVMATGIVAVAARLLHYEVLSWSLFVIALCAYVLLWMLMLAPLRRITTRPSPTCSFSIRSRSRCSGSHCWSGR
jgi:tellurite resistance protein TehA-like permease